MAKSRSEVPAASVVRLAMILRELQQIQRSGAVHVQSGSLAKRLGLNDSQVRRDLSCLGQVGQRGVGYRVHELISAIQNVLGTDRLWNVILIGVGNLGRALCGYRGFDQQGFRLVAAFDSDTRKVGMPIGPVQTQNLSQLEAFASQQPIDLAILAVPASAAPALAQRIEAAGIPGILNFAPVAIPSSSQMTVQHVDLAVELQRLAFAVVRRRRIEQDV